MKHIILSLLFALLAPFAASAATHDGFVIYVDNQTTWGENLHLYMWGDKNDLNGGWPGMAITGYETIDGVNYAYFDMGAEASGLKENLIFNNNGAPQLSDYKVTLDKDYYFRVEDSGITPLTGPQTAAGVALWPANVVLAKKADQVRVLSMNNSLIHYENEWQDDMFNSIAKAAGADALWTAHTNLGKTLAYHYNEGEGLTDAGVPSARMLVRKQPWSHIILQEQTALPRTDFATFRANVERWVKYIRTEGGNPNAVIIVPLNWAYNAWSSFTSDNAQFRDSYYKMAQELGVTVTPVGLAYQLAFEAEGSEEVATWFKDDRHPTQKATYMAACMEYANITGVDPTTIAWAPATITADEAAKMRSYAKQALEAWTQTVDQHAGTVRYELHQLSTEGLSMEKLNAESISVNAGGTMAEGVFTAAGELGSYTVTAAYDGRQYNATVSVAAPKMEVEVLPSVSINDEQLTVTENFDALPCPAADAAVIEKGYVSNEPSTLPTGWRIERNQVGPRTVGSYADAAEAAQYQGGVSLPSNAANGTWNFGMNGNSDRAVGGITTGVADGARTINVMLHLTNDSQTSYPEIKLAYDVEKYRDGSNAAGFDVTLYVSDNGVTWAPVGDAFNTHFEPGTGQIGYETVPCQTVHVEGTVAHKFAAGTDLYFAWSSSVTSGDNCASAPALAIDNVSLEAVPASIPTAAHYLYVDDQTGWETISVYAYGDAELYGAWPGQFVQGTKTIDDVTYKVFTLPASSGNYNLIFNNGNNGIQLGDFAVEATKDYYLRATAAGVQEINVENPGGDEPTEPDYAAIELSTSAASYAQNFDTLPCPAADATVIEKGYVSNEPSTLPTGWRIERNQVGPRVIGAYADAALAAQYQGGVSLPSNAANGTWNFGMNGSTDRAVGGMTTSVSNGARTINVMAAFKNVDDADIESLDIAYDVEKYRDGTNPGKFYVKLFTSADGITWTAAEGEAFTFLNEPGTVTGGFEVVPAQTTNVSSTLAQRVEAGKWLYLCWSICTSTGVGTDCAQAPALAIDNVEIAAKFAQPEGIATATAAPASATIYNLMGQRVNATQSGIYVKNGRKFVK